MTFNPGIDTFDQPLRDAWWTPGWTSQNQSYIPVAPNPFQLQGFPPSLNYVTVSGNYFDLDGNPLSGYLTFYPSSALTITASGGTTYLPQRYVGMNLSQMGSNQFGNGKVYLWNGQFAVSLLATDNSGMTPTTFTYCVVEHFLYGNNYSISVPSATTSPTDIHSLIIPGTYGTCSNCANNNTAPSNIIGMNLAAVSTEFITANITAMMGGVGINPTSYPVNFAFTTTSEPQAGQWHAGTWATNSAPYIAQILVGPANGALSLPVGNYQIWVEIVTSTQVPVLQIGTLTVY